MLTYALNVFTAGWSLAKEERSRAVTIPEPEFKPFRFPKKEVAARDMAPANVCRKAATLAELGVEAGLARDIESTLGRMGAVRGGRIVGFTFRTPDGASHALRASVEEKVAEVRAA